MRTSDLLTDHSVTLVLARQRSARSHRRVLAQLVGFRNALATNPQRISPLLHALGGNQRVARRATALALALGVPAGEALAAVLPAALAAVEAMPPHNAEALRRGDTMLCAALDLIERLVPERLVDVHEVVARQRASKQHKTWWTFRPWLRLNEALQRQALA